LEWDRDLLIHHLSTGAVLIAMFGPAIGDGSENVDMSQQAPWNTMRRR
jgi:hypothetical protein